jgi:diaminopimelate epimerase
MARTIDFTKMHGLGNDFVVVESDALGGTAPQTLAKLICHRQTGVGADGLLIVSRTDKPNVTDMRIFNADGSEATMCGNGIRCFARYVFDRGTRDSHKISVRTGAGLREVSLELENNLVARVRINMGKPKFEPAVRLAGPEHEDRSGERVLVQLVLHQGR